MSPAASSDDAPSRPNAGLERIVALALAAMVSVLALVYVPMIREPGPSAPEEFDWQNPMLLAQPGQCVEIGDSSSPGSAAWLVVRAPGVVERPFTAAKSIPGWSSPLFPDTRSLPPYLLCESRRAPSADRPANLPEEKDSPYIFPLNAFGMPVEAIVVLRDIMPRSVNWNGQTRRGYAVGLYRYDSQWNGPWVIHMSKDAPVLGTMSREYVPKASQRNQQTFRVPESCK